jgi:hypothetical protein
VWLPLWSDHPLSGRTPRLIGYANPGRTFTDTQEAWALNWRHWSGHGWLKAEHTTRAGNCLS